MVNKHKWFIYCQTKLLVVIILFYLKGMFVKIKILLISALLISTLASAKEIPIEHFSQMPSIDQPTISPDGTKVAAIYNNKDQTQVVISNFGSRELSTLVALGGEKYRIDHIAWANNQRVLVTVSQPYVAFGIRVRTTHIYSADITGESVFELRRKRAGKQTAKQFYFESPDLLSVLENDPDHVLVTLRDDRDDNYTSVFKVNINDGTFTKYLPNTNKITSWLPNKDGDILLSIGSTGIRNDLTSIVYVRKDVNSNWKKVKTFTPYESDTFDPVLFDSDTNTLIVLSDHKLNKNALWSFNIATATFTKLLGEAPENFDISSAIVEFKDSERKVVGYRYVDNFVKRVFFDKEKETISTQISSLFSKQGLQATLYDFDQSETKYIVSAVSDSSPGKFYLYDKVKKNISFWFSQYPYLEGKSLAYVSAIKFKARDGMELNGYLTLPNNVEKPPLVLFPHGGPYARDYQYFDPFVQMMANQGYAVLQVNYRGSTGFGNAYEAAGYHQWGKAMQTDLLDAVNWVKDNGYANTENSCIAGASYGGYAALVAGFQTPKMFKCIISIAGVSDLNKQMTLWRKKGYLSYIKNAVKDEDANIKSVSPIYHVDKFEVPVLLIHGKKDQLVSYRQSESMYKALDDADKDVKYEEFEYGTHHLNDANNRIKSMELMAEFLAENLK
jgi:dipeptidyl aminopeptidase/acylaminoacyl peptidase